MNELIASFVQHIPGDGYRLRMLEPVHLDRPHATDSSAEALCWPTQGEHSRSYQPLIEEESLFYRFADLGANPDSQEILAFANRYGWMGKGDPAVEADISYSDTLKASRQVISAEFTEDWRQQLSSLIPFLDLWHAVATHDDAYLRSVIAWHPESSSVTYQYKSMSSILIASSSMNAELFTTLTPGDIIAPAKVLLTRIINQQLSEHCSPALLFRGFSYQESHLYFRCNNLLGVIWLQFARAVANNTVHRRCVECASPFLPSRTERGRKKQFCTDACKSRNYRNKIRNRPPDPEQE